jgi:hypothetical protein
MCRRWHPLHTCGHPGPYIGFNACDAIKDNEKLMTQGLARDHEWILKNTEECKKVTTKVYKIDGGKCHACIEKEREEGHKELRRLLIGP